MKASWWNASVFLWGLAEAISITRIQIFIVWSKLNFVHQLAATNSMHLQLKHSPHSQHLQSDPHLESGRRSVVELFCRNSLCVKVVGWFRRGAPSLMFDGILNVTLSQEKVSTTRVTQGNLELLLRPNSPDSHQAQIQEYKILDWPTSSFPWKRTHLLGKQSKKRVTNSRAAAHKSCMVKCYPRTPGF